MDTNILAIDIGGSKIIAGIVDINGNISDSKKIILPDKYDINFIIENICNIAEKFISYNPLAVGIAIPGLTDTKRGIWKYAPFSGISDVPISNILSERLNLNVFIENDVNSCAVGEKMYGICKDDTDFLWMTVSNGIGGALYLNDSLYTGSSGNAGEIGHIIVEENTKTICGCGKVGCLEAMASGKGIEKMYIDLCHKKLTAQEIALLAINGEKTALEVYERAGYYIGKAIAYTINLLNIKKVILGGGVSQSFDLLKKHIHNAVEKYSFNQANTEYTIEKTGLGYYAALIGAAAVAQMNLK